MERRKASPEQLKLLLHYLEADKELAVGKFTGLDGRIRQTNAWIKITEKLNANSGFGSGAIKTPDKWQQTWRDWKSNVRKKAFKIRKNRFTPGCASNSQLTEAEENILKLISTNTSAFGLSCVPETSTSHENQVTDSHGNGPDEHFCESNPSTSTLKWASEIPQYTQINTGMSMEANGNPDVGLESNESSSFGNLAKPIWKKGRPSKGVHDRLLVLEEEKIKLKKQKLVEKKRCNNIRLKLEKDRLEIEKQRNQILEKLLLAVESVAHRQGTVM